MAASRSAVRPSRVTSSRRRGFHLLQRVQLAPGSWTALRARYARSSPTLSSSRRPPACRQQLPHPFRQPQGGGPARLPLLDRGGEHVPDGVLRHAGPMAAVGTLTPPRRRPPSTRRDLRRACLGVDPQVWPVRDDDSGRSARSLKGRWAIPPACGLAIFLSRKSLSPVSFAAVATSATTRSKPSAAAWTWAASSPASPSHRRLDVRYGNQLRPVRLPPGGRGLPQPRWPLRRGGWSALACCSPV